jgi:ATP-dependent exoDNAse (exonuclease V) beta subunit
MNFLDVVELETSFENVCFIEKEHCYTIDNKPSSGSVTQVLKRYEKPFEAHKIAKIVAARQGVLEGDILELWNFKKEYSCLKGTLVHTYIENFLQKKKTSLNKESIRSFVLKYQDCISEDQFYKDTANHISNFLHFYEMWKKDYVLIRSELVIGDKETQICGCIDNLSVNKHTGELCIFDYKSNKEIKRSNKEKMLGILKHLDSCELVKYSLQLGMYASILERNTNFKISSLNIIWLSGDNNFELIPALDLKKEISLIFQDIKNKDGVIL